jgi:hypothetical protein
MGIAIEDRILSLPAYNRPSLLTAASSCALVFRLQASTKSVEDPTDWLRLLKDIPDFVWRRESQALNDFELGFAFSQAPERNGHKATVVSGSPLVALADVRRYSDSRAPHLRDQAEALIVRQQLGQHID